MNRKANTIDLIGPNEDGQIDGDASYSLQTNTKPDDNTDRDIPPTPHRR